MLFNVLQARYLVLLLEQSLLNATAHSVENEDFFPISMVALEQADISRSEERTKLLYNSMTWFQ